MLTQAVYSREEFISVKFKLDVLCVIPVLNRHQLMNGVWNMGQLRQRHDPNISSMEK